MTLAREVATRQTGTAIVFISGDATEPMDFLVDAILQKPFRLEEIKATILKLLGHAGGNADTRPHETVRPAAAPVIDRRPLPGPH